MSKGNRTRRMEAGLLPARSYCDARTRDGTPCKNAPLLGARRCRMHGSGAPQVKDKAAQRLREGVMPMLGTLYRLANDDSLPPAVQLAAVRDWLDRSGIKESIVVEVQVQPWEHLAEVGGIVSEVPDGLLTGESGYSQTDVIDGEVLHKAEPPAALDGPAPTPPPPGVDEVRIPSRRSGRRVAGQR